MNDASPPTPPVVHAHPKLAGDATGGKSQSQPIAPKPPAPKPATPQSQQDQEPLRPTVRAAHMKRRHRGLILTFVLWVIIPFCAVAFYLTAVATDQYSSVAGFTERQEEQGGAAGLLGGLAQIAGGQTSSYGSVLYEFVLSQSLIRKVENQAELRKHYSQYWPDDIIFALTPDASIEDLESYWQRIVQVSYDQGTGLIELRVLAFTPDKAQEIAEIIIRESQDMINALNEQSRSDAMRYARDDLDEAVSRLKQAREALTEFRTRTQIVDPQSDLQGRMGVVNNLQQQLASALIELDLLIESNNTSDPRMQPARQKIEVIRKRITEERDSFSQGNELGTAYPGLLAEYEGLIVEREFAEETYRATLAALGIARTKASRQSRYLSTYVEPTLAETSEYPQRLLIGGLAGLFLLLSWSVIVLIYYSIRDRA